VNEVAELVLFWLRRAVKLADRELPFPMGGAELVVYEEALETRLRQSWVA
jgi:hypothetical protein